MADKKPLKLTAKQRALVLEYLKDKNAHKAAERAGFSAKTAHVLGPRTLGLPHVKAFLDEKMAELEEKLSFTAKDVMESLYAQGTFDKGLILNDDLTVKPISKWPPVARQMLEKVKVEEIYDGIGRDKERVGDIKDIALSPRTPALLGLLRVLKGEKVEHTGKDGGPMIVKWEGE